MFLLPIIAANEKHKLSLVTKDIYIYILKIAGATHSTLYVLGVVPPAVRF